VAEKWGSVSQTKPVRKERSSANKPLLTPGRCKTARAAGEKSIYEKRGAGTAIRSTAAKTCTLDTGEGDHRGAQGATRGEGNKFPGQPGKLITETEGTNCQPHLRRSRETAVEPRQKGRTRTKRRAAKPEPYVGEKTNRAATEGTREPVTEKKKTFSKVIASNDRSYADGRLERSRTAVQESTLQLGV